MENKMIGVNKVHENIDKLVNDAMIESRTNDVTDNIAKTMAFIEVTRNIRKELEKSIEDFDAKINYLSLICDMHQPLLTAENEQNAKLAIERLNEFTKIWCSISNAIRGIL